AIVKPLTPSFQDWTHPMTSYRPFAQLSALCLVLSACASENPDPDDGLNGTGGSGGGDVTATGGSSAAGGVTATGGVTASGGGGSGGNETSGGAPGSGGDPGSGGGSPDAGGVTIINDTFWEDTSGTPIYSQGGGVLQVGDTYYWYGVHYAGAQPYIDNPQGGKNGNAGFVGVTTYSSKDLVNWKHETTDKLANAGGWFGRLGVAYNANTKKYVLVAQGGGNVYFA